LQAETKDIRLRWAFFFRPATSFLRSYDPGAGAVITTLRSINLHGNGNHLTRVSFADSSRHRQAGTVQSRLQVTLYRESFDAAVAAAAEEEEWLMGLGASPASRDQLQQKLRHRFR
jgi:hypothetical protein